MSNEQIEEAAKEYADLHRTPENDREDDLQALIIKSSFVAGALSEAARIYWQSQQHPPRPVSDVAGEGIDTRLDEIVSELRQKRSVGFETYEELRENEHNINAVYRVQRLLSHPHRPTPKE